MATPEGKGLAKRAWDAYVEVIKKTIYPSVAPFIEPAIQPVARRRQLTRISSARVTSHDGIDELAESREIMFSVAHYLLIGEARDTSSTIRAIAEH